MTKADPSGCVCVYVCIYLHIKIICVYVYNNNNQRNRDNQLENCGTWVESKRVYLEGTGEEDHGRKVK